MSAPARIIVVILALCLLPGPARAMRIRSSVTLLAWSTDGESLLLLQEEHGPEGGGSSTYLVVGTRPPRAVSATVSSDFSPGDGSTPERVPVKACEQGLRQVERALRKLGIKGVAVHVKRCAGKDRAGLVTPKTAPPRNVLAVSKGKTVAVGLKQGRVAVSGPDGVEARLSPGAKVVLVLKDMNGDRMLQGVYRRRGAAFERVQLRRPKGGKW